jgi:hypothetical protein
MRLAGAILLLSALAMAQPRGTGIVAGVVAEAASGEPVRKAVVTLTLQGVTPPTWATARTDASGRFRFENLPPGKYGLRANKNGLGAAVYGATSTRDTGDIISLAPGDIREGLTLRFLRLATISGHVLNSDGDPIPGVQIQLERPARNLGERVLQNFRTAATDDRGEFRITGIDVGQYYLEVYPQSGRMRSGTLYAGQFYGGARELKDAKALNLRSDENLTGVDFLLNPEPAYRIQGRVTGVPDFGPPPPFPGGAAAVALMQRSMIDVSITAAGDSAQRWQNGTGVREPDYRFDFGGLAGGMYRLEARARVGDKTWAAWQLVDSRQTAGEIALPLTPALDITGVLRVEGQPDAARGSPQIVLNRFGRNNENISARPDAEGHFTLKQVPPGEWAMNVNNMPIGSFLKSGTFGRQDVRFSRFSIEAGTKDTFNIAISSRPAKLEGQIDPGTLHGKRAGIVLAPTGKFHDLARFYYGVTADDEGKFHLENLAPGTYRIFALERTAPAAFRNPEAIDQLKGLGDDVELTEGRTAQTHPKLIPAAQVREALPAELRE